MGSHKHHHLCDTSDTCDKLTICICGMENNVQMLVIRLVSFLLWNSKLNMRISTLLIKSVSFLCLVPLLKACSPPEPPPNLSPPTNGGENVLNNAIVSSFVWSYHSSHFQFAAIVAQLARVEPRLWRERMPLLARFPGRLA